MGWIEDKIRRCRSRACEEALLFVSDNLFRTRRNTLDIMDQVPSGWSGLNKLVREYVRRSMILYRGLVFEDEIRHAVIEGYHSALRGNLHSAEESNRFILERFCLSRFVERTSNIYLDLIKSRTWHRLVDSGFIITSLGEALSRRKRLGTKASLEGEGIFLAGKPVCRRHLTFPEYSRDISRFRIKGKVKCKCGAPAVALTLAMPKVSALIGLTCYLLGHDSRTLERIYSNLSRIVHPYGFVKMDREKAILIWFRDYFMLSTEFSKIMKIDI
ncbi:MULTISPECIES: hypothetical protein [Metallosphaera]|uniref:hypothetical protein n=1 Tax=Metallosphaera TaxID=41980 RepID=UPI001F05A616|nr:hypothetical protein [Metallosphaera sedula]MCH1770370.1 hypothetical protein [Metallosphaera sedula]MCP6727796.1 hypothetical protein [Metallosphaera sedula]